MPTLTQPDKDQLQKLVVAPLSRTAREAHAAAVTRLGNIVQQLGAAAEADKQAQAAYRRALAGDGDLTMLDAGRQAKAAAHDLEVMNDAKQAAEALVAKALEDQQQAERTAWAPVVMDGIRRRIAAARAADDARKGLAAAEAAYALADEIMGWAIHGHHAAAPAAQGWEGRNLGNRTEAEERRYWQGAHVDLDRGTFPGMPVVEAAQ